LNISESSAVAKDDRSLLDPPGSVRVWRERHPVMSFLSPGIIAARRHSSGYSGVARSCRTFSKTAVVITAKSAGHRVLGLGTAGVCLA
jgi:hypothetical protein